MGWSETTKKLAFLRARFPLAHADYKHCRDCYTAMNPAQGHDAPPPEQQIAVIIDGSVHLEPGMCLSTPSVVVKDRKAGKDPAIRVAGYIHGKIQQEMASSSNIASTIVIVLGDTHERPEIKEDRGYSEESKIRVFEGFPIQKEALVEEHIEGIKKKYISRMEARASPKKSSKKKVGEESDEEDDNDEEESMSAHDKHKTYEMNKAIEKFKKHSFDSWSEGKSLPRNRFIVYRLLTKHIVAMIQEDLKSTSNKKKIVLDNAVLEKDEYCTLYITEDSVKSESTPHHGICECEQLMIYWIHKLMATERKSRFMLTTTDTDIITCVSLHWESIVASSPEPIGEKMIMLKVPNTDNKSVEAQKYFRVVDFYHIFSGIPIEEIKEWSFLTFIVMGCDFVDKLEMHNLLQKSKGGMFGQERMTKLMELFYSRRREAPRRIARFTQHPDKRYRNGMEWQVTMDIPAFLELVAKYRKEDKNEKFSGFTPKVVAQLTYRLKTAVYACEYFLNQWRLKKNAGRLFRDPASNPGKYGYTRGPDGNLVIVLSLKKQAKAKKAEKDAKKKPGSKKWGDDNMSTKKKTTAKKTTSKKEKAKKKKEKA